MTSGIGFVMERFASRLLVAAAWLACAPACSSPAERVRPLLIDPGFENAVLAPSPVRGWYSDDASAGRLRITSDSSARREGAGSLRVEVVEPRDPGEGRASLSQVVTLSPGAPRRYELSVALRASVAEPLRLAVYVWDGNEARELATQDVAAGSDWTPATIRFEVPAGHDRFGVFLYLPNSQGATVWLDAARLEARS